MVTQIEKQETKTESKRIFTGLDTSRLNSTTTEYRRPHFSELDFEEVSTTETGEVITRPLDIQKQEPAVSKESLNSPSTTSRARLNARGKIILSVAIICICALMTFMIGNIVTICNLNSTISYKEQVVAGQQQTVNDLRNQSNNIEENLYEAAQSNGYAQIDAQNVVETENITRIEKPKAEIEGNWFDNLCNFFANMF